MKSSSKTVSILPCCNGCVHVYLCIILLVKGVTVLVDSKALITILGSEMDYVEDKLSSQFVFHNPNAKGVCGCGESFAV